MPHGLFGMAIFVISEIMFFAGMISAFLIVKAAATSWPPLDQPRLPVEGFFVVFQGAEWVALLNQGLTLTSSSLAAFSI